MQHAMWFAVPDAGLKQHGMNGPPDAKLVPAKTAPIAIRTVMTPRSRIPYRFISEPPSSAAAAEPRSWLKTLGTDVPAVYSRIRESCSRATAAVRVETPSFRYVFCRCLRTVDSET
jgi:hypothetical protein